MSAPSSISLTPKTFLERLTMAEVVGVMTSTIPEIIYFRTMFCVSERIVSTDPLLPVGMQMLVTHGLLTDERRAQIMSYAA
jgi:hypothetical protein